jgi:hypothetical protein
MIIRRGIQARGYSGELKMEIGPMSRTKFAQPGL